MHGTLSYKPSTVTLSWEVKVKGEARLLGVRPLNLAREAGASLHCDLQTPGLQLALVRGVWRLERGPNKALHGGGINRRNLKPWERMSPRLE